MRADINFINIKKNKIEDLIDFFYAISNKEFQEVLCTDKNYSINYFQISLQELKRRFFEFQKTLDKECFSVLFILFEENNNLICVRLTINHYYIYTNINMTARRPFNIKINGWRVYDGNDIPNTIIKNHPNLSVFNLDILKHFEQVDRHNKHIFNMINFLNAD